MSIFQRGQRALHIEELAERCVLSAMPITPNIDVPAAGEGESASVTQDGQVVTVIGSDNDDSIQIELSDSVHKLLVNGDMTEYDVSTVNEFVVRGDGGRDAVTILGSDKDESVQVDNAELTLNSDSHTVKVSLVEVVTVNAGAGTSRAAIFDSEGDDALSVRPNSASFNDANGNRFVVNDFDRITSFATKGGTDQANFHGSTETDTFIGKAAFSYMVGNDFWNYARGYERVDVFQESLGNDTAWLFGSPANDTVAASPDEVILTLDGGNVLASHGFSNTQVHTGAGDDSGILQGRENAADRLTWNPDSAEMTTSSTGQTITNTFRGLEKLEATGGESTDSAELFGSNAADELIALPDVVQLTTPDATVMAHNFAFVSSHGGDGVDFAHLEDSRFNDQYVGKPGYAYISGPGYLNLTTGFDEIDVAATNGGYDLSTTHYGAAIYTIAGGQASLPFIINDDDERVQVGQFERTTLPGAPVAAFTQYELDNNLIVYVHSESNDDPFDIDLELRFNNQLGVESTGRIQFPVNKDGAGKRFEVTAADITGDVNNFTGPLESNYFVLDVNQHWIFGTSRSERVFGISRFRATGPGNLDRTAIDESPYFFGTRVNQNGQVSFPVDMISDLESRDDTPVANYDLIDGVLVNIGNATLNPPQIDF